MNFIKQLIRIFLPSPSVDDIMAPLVKVTARLSDTAELHQKRAQEIEEVLDTLSAKRDASLDEATRAQVLVNLLKEMFGV